jgi:hypothetical protein
MKGVKKAYTSRSVTKRIEYLFREVLSRKPSSSDLAFLSSITYLQRLYITEMVKKIVQKLQMNATNLIVVSIS